MDDARNTNITLTVREVCGDVPIAAFVDDKDSVDVLELSGASSVLALKQRLGEQLATRVMVGTPQAHRVGRYKDLVIAESPVHKTPLAGRIVADTRLRQLTGLNLVAYSERGRLLPARADTQLSDYAVAVVVGTESQVASLDALFVIYEPNENPVLVIGGGKVGRAVTRALKARDVVVHIVEANPGLQPLLSQLADRVITGNAADLDVITGAGVDFVLSQTTLGVTSLLSLVHGRELVLVGEGVDLFVEPLPHGLAGRTLGDAGIGAQTGLNVVAVQSGDGPTQNPSSSTELVAGLELVMLGSPEQLAAFRKTYA